jgi:hypothetical protein
MALELLACMVPDVSCKHTRREIELYITFNRAEDFLKGTLISFKLRVGNKPVVCETACVVHRFEGLTKDKFLSIIAAECNGKPLLIPL